MFSNLPGKCLKRFFVYTSWSYLNGHAKHKASATQNINYCVEYYSLEELEKA